MFEELKEILKEIKIGTVTDEPLMKWYHQYTDIFKKHQLTIFDSDLQDRHFGFLFRTTNEDILQKVGTDRDFYDLTHYYHYSNQCKGWYNDQGEAAYSERDIIRLITEIQYLLFTDKEKLN